MPDMTQKAPYPAHLAGLVARLKYRPGWTVTLDHIDRGQGSVGLTLIIKAHVVDTYHPDQSMRILHYMIVPAASYDERSWRRWLFEQLLLVERHECAEFFQIGDERPYAPNHGPGHDPYVIFEEGTRQEKRTSYLGVERSGDDPDTEE